MPFDQPPGSPCCWVGVTSWSNTRATGASSPASILHEPWDTNMQRFANPLLRHVICRGCFDTASKRQCLQYLRALRSLHLNNGFNTIFLGETDIPESLISGEKNSRGGQPVLAGMDTCSRWQLPRVGALEVQTAIKRWTAHPSAEWCLSGVVWIFEHVLWEVHNCDEG